MALKFSFILEAVDRATAPARRVRAATRGLVAGAKAMGEQMRRTAAQVRSGERSLEHFQRRASRMRQIALGRVFQAAGDSARRMADRIDRATRNLKLMERAGRGAKSGLSWMGGKAMDLGKWGLAAAAAAGGFALFDLFRTAGQFEQYQIQLEGIEGSAAKARQAMRWVQDFAEKTPFELAQVMEAFVALKAYGIDPTNGSLMALGDGAAGMSKPIMQAIEALADATTGEFERLKEFGIRAEKQGDRVTFKYRQNGKDIRREAAFTGSAIEEAITGIFNDRFGGGMARQAGTLFGIVSNLKDLWSKFLVMVADAGIFDTVKKRLDEWRGSLDKMARDGRLQKWAEAISDKLELAWDWGVRFAEQTDWNAVGRGLATAVEALVKLVELLGRAAQIADDLASRDLYTVRTEATRKTKPREGQTGGFFDLFTPKRERDLKPKGKQSSLSTKAQNLRKGTATPASTKVGGKIEVAVKVDGPGTARVTSLKTANRDVALAVRTGKTMVAAA